MNMGLKPIKKLLTIGHSNHELAYFESLLDGHGVTAVVDVRSHPYSRMNPQFNREVLQTVLRRRGIQYVFLGNELGARRLEAECYEQGKAKYDRIVATQAFTDGLARLRRGMRDDRLALMCTEKDPLTCHRTILVCRALRNDHLNIQHILANGSVESMADVEDRLLELVGLPREDLFRSKEELLQEAYRRQGDRIAYVETEHANDKATIR